jgi:acyl dehydratase
MPVERYWEDLAVGDVIETGTVSLFAEEMKAFAREFDPQPFHVDERAATDTFFGGLVASGLHTLALSMRLLVESDCRIAGGFVGIGLDELKFCQPVRPGDSLRVVSELVESRPSKSRPGQGVARYRVHSLNQDNELVLSLVTTLLVPRRPE